MTLYETFLFNMSPVLLQHSLQTAPEGLAGVADLRGVEVGRHGRDGGLQAAGVAVVGRAGLLLQPPLQVEITWIQIRAAGGPGLHVPEVGEVAFHPVLDQVGLVGRRRVLLERVGLVPGHGVHPGLHHVPHDFQVDLLVHHLAGLEEVGGHDIPVRADDAQDHDRCRLLAPEDHRDLGGLLADPPLVPPVDGDVHREDLLV